MAFSLHTVAPRLARARDAWVEEQRELRAQERAKDRREASLATKRLKAERLLAHRELQMLRAAAKGNAKYFACRSRKLAAAQRNRDRLG